MTFTGFKNGSRLLFDTVALIYYLERHEIYGSLAQEVITLVETGKVKAVLSSLVFAELLVMPYAQNDTRMAKELVRELCRFPNMEIVPVDVALACKAARLRAQYGLKTPDAIHAATALQVEADLLITNDKGLRCLEEEKLKIWLFDEHMM